MPANPVIMCGMARDVLATNRGQSPLSARHKGAAERRATRLKCFQGCDHIIFSVSGQSESLLLQ
jgi:hypothetical protein